MKGQKWERICYFFLVMFAVFFGLQIVETLGALLRTGCEAVWNSWVHVGTHASAINYYYVKVLEYDILHLILQTLLWTPVVWVLKEKRMVKRGFGYFLLIVLLFVVAFELVSYIAYLLQFVGDACISGISSREPNLILKNIVSWNRWLNVDWVGRACEAIVISKILFFVGGIIENRKSRRAAQKAAAEAARMRREQKRRDKEEEMRQERERQRREAEHFKEQMRKSAEFVPEDVICLPGETSEEKEG